jgi:hypothetical protein
MRLLLLVLVLVSNGAAAQVYRWIEGGTVHYSNDPPPANVKATKLDIDAKAGPASADSQECYTVRCQGERMEDRLARREQADARIQAERVATAPPRPRGLEFRRYISIYRGMTEGELLGIAGPPDFEFRDRSFKTYTYMPTPSDPFTSTIKLVNGQVNDFDRVRKY